MTHTKGPWLAIKQDHENTCIQNEYGDLVCILKNKYHKPEDIDLFCAAPDLLEALEDIYKRGYEMGQHEMVRAAIAKARGQQ